MLVGLTIVAVTTAAFGLASEAWQLDLARFCQGLASSFSWTGALAWLVASSPSARRGQLIGQAFAAAVAGALLGPVLGGIAAVAGTGWTFGAVAIASLGLAAWAVVDAGRPAERAAAARGCSVEATRDRRVLLSIWFVVLPALLFGTLVGARAAPALGARLRLDRDRRRLAARRACSRRATTS